MAPIGRPRSFPTEAQIRLVQDAHREQPVGVVKTAHEIRRHHDISYHTVYNVLKKSGAVTASTARPRKPKWLRFERLYSNALWHTDWHEMKDPR